MSKFEKFIKDEFINKPLMASEIIGAMSQPKRTILGYHQHSYAEAAIRKLQVKLVNAQKFVISNDLIDHAIEASLSRPYVLNQMIKSAIPPFKNMFIEWDEHYRVHAMSKLYHKHLPEYKDRIEPPKDHLDRIGYHIHEKAVDDPGAYAMLGDNLTAYEMWSLLPKQDGEKEGKWIMSPMSNTIINDEYCSHNRLYQHFLNTIHKASSLGGDYNKLMKDEESFTRNQVKDAVKLLGHPYVLKYFGEFDQNDKYWKATPLDGNVEDYQVMNEIYSRLNTTTSSSMDWICGKDEVKGGYVGSTMQEIARTHLALLQGGDMRFIISVLSLLNYDLIVQQKQQPAKNKITHVRYGKRVPTNEYNLINIDLPKPKGRVVYEKIFTGHGSPKRWHLRRGHWRRYRDAKGNVTRRVWVDQCEAGSKDLGSKINDYNLQKAKGEN